MEYNPVVEQVLDPSSLDDCLFRVKGGQQITPSNDQLNLRFLKGSSPADLPLNFSHKTFPTSEFKIFRKNVHFSIERANFSGWFKKCLTEVSFIARYLYSILIHSQQFNTVTHDLFVLFVPVVLCSSGCGNENQSVVFKART